jgi:hypothetical protein
MVVTAPVTRFAVKLSTELVEVSANNSALELVFTTLLELAGPVVEGSAVRAPEELMEKPRI